MEYKTDVNFHIFMMKKINIQLHPGVLKTDPLS